MWSALENIALRESLPLPLSAGDSIHDILVAAQLDRGRYNLHHLGRRRSKPYLLKQFYSIDTNAFLRWQNEARFAMLPQIPGYNWPCEEWRGGVISPFPEGITLDEWLQDDIPPQRARLEVAALLAQRLARLHRSGICHRHLSPTSIRIGNASLAITDFGAACCNQWDDFWTDSVMSTENIVCASPESLHGESNGQEDDVYAFGALLHLLISGKDAFGSLKKMIKAVLPNAIPPDDLTAQDTIPSPIRELARACLAPSATDRPTIIEATSTLEAYGTDNTESTEPFPIPTEKNYAKNGQKIMVFIKDDDRATPLFDAVLQKAEEEPSLFLFIGLIPCNLPSGHMERFKGNLFKKLGQGLLRCRAAHLPWGLRVFENTVPEKTALELAKQYRPDHILLGKTTSKTPISMNGIQSFLMAQDIPITLIS